MNSRGSVLDNLSMDRSPSNVQYPDVVSRPTNSSDKSFLFSNR